MAKKHARKRRNDQRTEERKPRRIPTDEDFARAEAAMRERDRGLSTIGEIVRARFYKLCPTAYGFYVLWQDDPNFRAYFFVEGRNAVDDFASSDAYTELQDLVYKQLDAVGRGARDEITVEFSVDDRAMYLAK
jgi:hypothetical protein